MRFLILPLVALLPLSSVKAVEFTSLSRSEPVSLTHTAEFSAYVDFSLSLSGERLATNALYLQVRYIIGSDTLTDNITITGSRSGQVKQLLLKEGERVTAQVFLKNGNLETVDGLEGSFRAATNTQLTVSKDIVGATFPGHVWIREHNPLFRVKLDGVAPRNVQLTFHFDGNYEFDALHFKVKVISPEQGILMLPSTIRVTDEPFLNLRDKTVTMTLEGVNFSYQGSYYLQVMHAMKQERVNGISKVSYEVVPQ